MSETLAERLCRTWAEHCNAEEELNDTLGAILVPPGEKWYDGWWDDTTTDPCDWDGWSVEFKDAKEGLVPTDEQMERIWALGFTVIRIDYKGRKEHRGNGDWWRVKGLPEGVCGCKRA